MCQRRAKRKGILGKDNSKKRNGGDNMEYNRDVPDLLLSDGQIIKKLSQNGFLVTSQGQSDGNEKKVFIMNT